LGSAVGAGATSHRPWYDRAGNMIGDGRKFRYVYDSCNQSVGVYRRRANGDVGSLFAKFTYNALGWRTTAVHDLNGGGAGPGPSGSEFAGDGLLADETIECYQHDEHWRVPATYFSARPSTSGSNPLSVPMASLALVGLDNRIGFAGCSYDPHLKMYHVRHRVYDPVDARWLQRDPIG